MDSRTLTAAHKSLPFGTKLLVENVDTGRSVVVTVNDRGPFNNRVIDVSQAAAEELGMLRSGVAHVKLAPLPSDLILTNGDTLRVADVSDTSTNALTTKVQPIVRALHSVNLHTQRHPVKKRVKKNAHRKRDQWR